VARLLTFLLLAAAAGADDATLSLQVTLDRLGFSPGCLDGKGGPQTRQALAAWQLANGAPATDVPAELPISLLYTNHTVTTNDTAQLGPWPKDWRERSRLTQLTCETITELLAEKFHCKESLLHALNPRGGDVWRAPNTAVTLPARRAARVQVSLGQKFARVFDAQGRLIAHFPCSIPAAPAKRVPASLTVANVALHPNYTFDPVNFPELDAHQKGYGKLILAPGPNNPVGTAWIGLSKTGYGLHGTPHPEDIGKTESHGCFRLANWNAERLARMVEIGTPVEVVAE
jgi:peptidoglycan hydrolase-like protein with peptidoglycan-binding domain